MKEHAGDDEIEVAMTLVSADVVFTAWLYLLLLVVIVTTSPGLRVCVYKNWTQCPSVKSHTFWLLGLKSSIMWSNGVIFGISSAHPIISNLLISKHL